MPRALPPAYPVSFCFFKKAVNSFSELLRKEKSMLTLEAAELTLGNSCRLKRKRIIEEDEEISNKILS